MIDSLSVSRSEPIPLSSYRHSSRHFHSRDTCSDQKAEQGIDIMSVDAPPSSLPFSSLCSFSHYMQSVVVLTLLCSLYSLTQSLTPTEACSLCQSSLRTVHSSFIGRSPSKRLMNNQLKRECRRHYTYRRRCLSLVKQFCMYMYAELISPSFKPVKVCYVLNECIRYESLIVDEQLAALNETLPSSPDEYTLMREETVERVIKSLSTRRTTTPPPDQVEEVQLFLKTLDNTTSIDKSSELIALVDEP